MAISLRDYQAELLSSCRLEMRTNKSVLMQLDTGGGKTAISSEILRGVAKKQKSGAFMCHRIELVKQTMRTFTDFGIPFGVICAGYDPNPYQPIQICMIPTLASRIRRGKAIPKFDLCVWDECHHVAAGGWAAIKAALPDAWHIGVTATPERLDGKGLGDFFTAMVQGPAMSWLMGEGWLSRYRAYAPSIPDAKGMHTEMGDYSRSENEAKMDIPSITGDAVEHYLRLARGKRGIVFCTTVNHSKRVVDEFRAAGVAAYHLDGTTDKDERERVVEAFKRNEIKILSNVDLFAEGFDVPGAEVVIMLRMTQSMGLFRQWVGRVLRPIYADGFDLGTREGRLAAIAASDKPHAIILDHAGNVMRHGLPDQDYAWSLEGSAEKRKKGKKENTVDIKQCPKCFACHMPAPACPYCGHEYVSSKEVLHVDGELVEINEAALAAHRKAQEIAVKKLELKAAKTLPELIELGRKRGYNNPARWAQMRMEERQAWRNKNGRSYAR